MSYIMVETGIKRFGALAHIGLSQENPGDVDRLMGKLSPEIKRQAVIGRLKKVAEVLYGDNRLAYRTSTERFLLDAINIADSGIATRAEAGLGIARNGDRDVRTQFGAILSVCIGSYSDRQGLGIRPVQ